MIARVALLRHGETAGNARGLYTGRTDEPLSDAGRAQLLCIQPPPAHRVLTSPMLRCAQTAALLYPGVVPEVVADFREIDFGAFENRAYRDLDGRADYQAWIDSGGTLPFPGGEARPAFIARCVAAFDAVSPSLSGDVAIIVHGGTLMALLSQRAVPARDYFAYHVKNGRGFLTAWDGRALRVMTAL